MDSKILFVGLVIGIVLTTGCITSRPRGRVIEPTVTTIKDEPTTSIEVSTKERALMAVELGDVSLCYETRASDYQGKKLSAMEASCIHSVAIKTQDASLCDQLSSSYKADGGERCKDNVALTIGDITYCYRAYPESEDGPGHFACIATFAAMAAKTGDTTICEEHTSKTNIADGKSEYGWCVTIMCEGISGHSKRDYDRCLTTHLAAAR